MKFLLTMFVAVSLPLAAQMKVGPGSDMLILTNVNVIDTRNGLTQPNLTLVIKNGLIQAVAKVGIIDSRKTRVINADGKYVIPGLWDMHAHTAGGSAKPWDEKVIFPLYIANGTTGIRDMGGDPNILEQRRRQVESGEVLGPHMAIAGPFLNRGNSDTQTIGVNTPAEARAAVDSVKSRGLDFVKVLSLEPDIYKALAEEATRQHIRFVGHVPIGVSAFDAAKMGQGSIEHLSGVLLASSSQEAELRQEMLAAIEKKDWSGYSQLQTRMLDTFSADKARQLFSTFVDNCTWQVPTLVWDVAQDSVDNPALAQDARMKYVPASIAKTWDPAKMAQEAGAAQLEQSKKITAQYMRMIDVMRRAGVMMMAGSDGPDPFVFPGFSLHEELQLLVKVGLRPAQALQAATFYPALFLTKLNQYGVVEVGHVADLVVLDDDPLKDISNTKKISAVIVRGRYFGREDLDKMLEHAAEIAKTQ